MKSYLKKVKASIIRNLSILFVGCGAISIYVSNILLKDLLSVESYSDYSIIISYLSIIGSFGLFGTEQTYLRVSTMKNNKILTSYSLLKVIFLIAIANSILLSLIVGHFFLSNIALIVLVIITFSSLVNQFSFNYFRLKYNLLKSQFVSNFWKIGLFILIIVTILFKDNIGGSINSIQDISLILLILTSITIPILIVNLYINRQNIEFVAIDKKQIKSLTINFLISLVSLSLISNGEKFLIKSKFGDQVLSEYFYLNTIFLYPFLFFQNYLGFKELIHFKMNPSFTYLKFKFRQATLLNVVVIILSLAFSYLIDFFGLVHIQFDQNILYIVTFCFIGSVRVYHSILSAAVGAHGSVDLLRNANIAFMTLLLVILFIFIFSSQSIYLLLMFLGLLWLIRALIFYIVAYYSLQKVKMIPKQ